MEQFVAEIALSQEKIKLGHTARMQAVMEDIRTLKNSVSSSSELDQNSQEMKRLRFQVAQYENILPVYQSRLKDAEDLNRRRMTRKQNWARTLNGSSRNWTKLNLSSSAWEPRKPSGKENQLCQL